MVGAVPPSPVTEFRELPATGSAFRVAQTAAKPTHFARSRWASRELQANLISAAGAVLCLVAGAVLVATGSPVALVAVLFSLGVLCDLADGAVARRATRRTSGQSGRLIDSIADKVGEIGFWLALLIVVRSDLLVFGLAIFAFGFGILTSFLKAFAEASRLDLEWGEARIFGRAGRAVLIAATLWSAAIFGPDRPEGILVAGLGALLLFNSATCVWRSLQIIGDLSHSRQPAA
jgi:phosphatidylglycerophosphate synthase